MSAGLTTPRTWVAGETVTAAEMNANVRDNVATLASRCQAYFASSFTVSAGITAQPPVNTEVYDSADNMLSVVSSICRVTIVRPGKYRLRYRCGSPVGNTWSPFIKKNGTTSLFTSPVTSGNTDLDFAFPLIAGDFVEPWVTSSAGAGITSIGAVNTVPGATIVFDAEWVGP